MGIVNDANPRIHLLIIHSVLMNTEMFVDHDFNNLFSTLLQHVLELLHDPEARTHSLSYVKSILSVMSDCLSRMSSLPEDTALLDLWSFLWSFVDPTLSRLLLDFFSRNITVITPSLLLSFLSLSIHSPFFTEVGFASPTQRQCEFEYWCCACRIWKGLNSKEQRLSNNAITDWKGFVAQSESCEL